MGPQLVCFPLRDVVSAVPPACMRANVPDEHQGNSFVCVVTYFAITVKGSDG